MEPVRVAHPENAAGPFYVENGCCMSCGMPMLSAPDLFQYDGSSHCFVKRQAKTKDEVDRMVRTTLQAEAQCIRYRGTDPATLQRLAELNLSAISDTPLPTGVIPIVRNCVSFSSKPTAPLTTPAHVAKSLRSFLERPNETRAALGERYMVTFRRIHETPSGASFDYAWYETRFYSLALNLADRTHARWLLRHDGGKEGQLVGVGLSCQIHDWLMGENELENIRWYTEQDWSNSGSWSETPW
jgi:ferredoxin